ncbi:MAG: hypothetical protein HOI80_04700 [Alphaproteobacteria bacterium]|jgi:beta-lactamase superfamily II metal-dependent hydrolase|nr:hypothetical protein [Alphaproteobacteria bacterium]MBT5390237.1 hypothetical protein [Alphaproteobacteria bacterium]MBT5654779.1 hypothetical protein [Alphaproteobacteria bacterium]
MRIYRVVVSLTFLFIAIANIASSNDFEATVYDVGQGNGVVIRYRDKALIVDAGSVERVTSTAFRKKLEESEAEELSYFITKLSFDLREAGVDVSENSRVRSGSGDSKESSHGSAGSGATLDSHASEGDLGADEDAHTVAKEFVERVQKKLDGVSKITVVVSHADTDHYNLLPLIFEENEWNEKISHIILGGFKSSYVKETRTNSSFARWLKDLPTKNVFYTGLKEGAEAGNAEDRHDIAGKVAPPYPHPFDKNFKPKSVQLIEDSLGTEADDPLVLVLSMNAGHSMVDRETAGVANHSDNSNSLVLKVEFNDHSFLLPGDVNATGWDRIVHFWKDTLRSDILLLSHHGGSSENYQDGSYRTTTLGYLEAIMPRAVFVSAGHRKRYDHPEESVINIVEQHLDSQRITTNPHYVHVFRTRSGTPKVFERKKTKQPIYTTFSSGDLSFSFETGEEEIKVTATRGKSMEVSERDTENKYEKSSRGYRNLEDLKDAYSDHKINIFQYDGEDRKTIIPKENISAGDATQTIHVLYISPKGENEGLYRLLIKVPSDER